MTARHTDLTSYPKAAKALRFDTFLAKVSRVPISYSSVGWYVATLELVLIVAIGALSDALYVSMHLDAAHDQINVWPLCIACAVLFVMGMQSQHLYRPAAILHPVRLVRTMTMTWFGVFCLMLVFGFIAKTSAQFSRIETVFFFSVGAIVLPLYRVGAQRMLMFAISNNILVGRRSVVLFGDRSQLLSRGIADDLKRHGYNVTGQFDLSVSDSLSAYREVTTAFERLQSFVQQNTVHEIFLIFGANDQRLIDLVTGRMRELPIPVRVLLDQKLGLLLCKPLVDLGPAKAVKIQGGPLTESQQKLKRGVDIILSALGLVVLAPVLVAVAAAIRLDSPGPVLFRQRRTGFSGRTFSIYKFRSMTTLDDGAVVVQATRSDRRVTRVGRYIRKTSLDELPQLLNVLRGEMSIVGPRPHALSHDNQYIKLIATYALRHHMKPGITGWAQVNGCRGETADVGDMAARVEYDLWYIVHWSMLLDIKTIALTVLQAVRPANVY